MTHTTVCEATVDAAARIVTGMELRVLTLNAVQHADDQSNKFAKELIDMLVAMLAAPTESIDPSRGA